MKLSIISSLTVVFLSQSVFSQKCLLTVDLGFADCTGYMTKYYYDKDTNTCEMFEFSGCGGNANKFDTLAICESACVLSAMDTLHQIVETHLPVDSLHQIDTNLPIVAHYPVDGGRGRRGDERSGSRGGDRSGRRGDERSGRRGDGWSGRRGDERSGRRGDGWSGRRGDERSGRRADGWSGRRGDERSGRRGDGWSGRRGDERSGRRGGDGYRSRDLGFAYSDNRSSFDRRDKNGHRDSSGPVRQTVNDHFRGDIIYSGREGRRNDQYDTMRRHNRDSETKNTRRNDYPRHKVVEAIRLDKRRNRTTSNRDRKNKPITIIYKSD